MSCSRPLRDANTSRQTGTLTFKMQLECYCQIQQHDRQITCNTRIRSSCNRPPAHVYVYLITPSGDDRNYHLGGYSPGDLGDGSPPVGFGVQGRCPIEGLGNKVHQKLNQFADIVYRFWLQKKSKFENFAQFISWFSTSIFHVGG